MVSSMVSRATSELLIGPDWAMNIEICDILNRDPGQAKDVVRGLKKRIGHKNPKIQLLALTLLETVVKNCGDIVHMHVAEKDVLNEMVKIVKKKPDLHVKEKILVLIDTWQEAFGGPRARYPQYYAVYQELLRAGAVFPQKSERSAPVLTPLQSQPLALYSQPARNAEHRQEAPESSTGSDLPDLSLSDIHNARGIVDVLAEMLSALEPGNKEGLKQEVIVDLVEQCRAYKMRVVRLVNTTSDEELLSQGLSLNDDLQRILAKHDAISSGATVRTEKVKTLQSLVDVEDSTADKEKKMTQNESSTDTGSGSLPLQQLLLPAPPAPSSNSNSASKMESHIDLLSGENFVSPIADGSLAIVPVSQPSIEPPNQQNILALVDMFSENNSASSSLVTQPVPAASQSYPSASPIQQQLPLQPIETISYTNGGGQSTIQPQYVQTTYAQNAHLNHESGSWNGHGVLNSEQQQQVLNYGTNAQSNANLPPPPWEAQPTQSSYVDGEHTQPMQSVPSFQQSSQFMGMPQSQPLPSGMLTPSSQNSNDGHQAVAHPQTLPNGSSYPQYFQGGPTGVMYPQQMQSSLAGGMGMYPHQMQSIPYGMYRQPEVNDQQSGMYPQPVQLGPQMGMYPQQMGGAVFAGHPYGQYPGSQYLEVNMRGLSVQDDNRFMNTSHQTPPSYVHPRKPPKTEDKLFGDLVDIAKSKPNKPGGL